MFLYMYRVSGLGFQASGFSYTAYMHSARTCQESYTIYIYILHRYVCGDKEIIYIYRICEYNIHIYLFIYVYT